MNESQYVNLQVKQWRAITVNWDILATNSLTETKLYCLTDFQAAWLLSMTEYMRWSTRWENCPCTQNDLEALKAEMDFNLMSCIDFQPFQMQYLYDSAQQNLIGDYTDSWDGSLPSSVNPDAPDDFFNGDDSDERNDALCTALTLWAYSYALNWLQKASVILNLAFAASEVVAFMIPVGGQIAVQAISDLVAPLQAQFDALQNLIALDQVICDWRDALDGVAINITNWSSAVAGLSYTEETDQWYIQQLFESDSQLLGNFLSFVNSLGQGFELANIGVSICACNVETWSQEFDFAVESFSSLVTNDWDASYPANWQSGLGWVMGQDALGARGGMYITLPEARTVTKVIVDTYLNRTATNTRSNGALIYDDTPDQGNNDVARVTEVYQTTGSKQQTLEETHDDILYVAGIAGSRNGASAVARVTKLTIFGEGTNPFI